MVSLPFTVHHARESHHHIDEEAVLDFVIMRQLFVAFPKADSGTLSWLKAVFVCNASLAYLSIRILELHKYLLHASSALSKTIITNVEEMQQIDLDKMMEEIWDYHPPKLFADIFEAICGAIFIDCGYDVEIVSEVLGPILSPFFASLRYAQRIDPIAKLIRWAVRVSHIYTWKVTRT
jgi:endoribonuclease Dicer